MGARHERATGCRRRPALLLALATGLPAQAVILPSAAAVSPPSVASPNTSSFAAVEAHSQLFYDVEDIAPFTALWTSLQVRRDTSLLGPSPAYAASVRLVLSVSPFAHDAVSTTFASNLGSYQAIAFTGPLSLAASQYSPRVLRPSSC